MATSNPTEGVYYYNENETNTVFKITYYKGTHEFRVFKQFYDEDGKYRRFTMRKLPITDYDEDLKELIRYIKTELVRKNDIVPQKGNSKHKENKVSAISKEAESSGCQMIMKKSLSDKIETHEDQKSLNQEEADNRALSSIQHEQFYGPKSVELERLFIEWERAQENEPEESWKRTNGGNINIGKGHFRRDGIIDEKVFEKEDVKILFISAEANDDEYSAKTLEKTSNISDFRIFHYSGKDDWGGKMRERLSEMYKVIRGIERNSMSNREAVLHFAVMDINKRGGGPDIKDGKHIEAYCKYFAGYIRKEIELIDPDIVAIIGINLFNLKLHEKYLGAITENGRYYFNLNGKAVPILSLWQTSYYQGKNEPLSGYEDNRTVGKQAARCVEELKKYGITSR